MAVLSPTDKTNIALCSIISTLADTGPAPQGVMYAAMMSQYTLAEFQNYMSILRSAGLIATDSAFLCTITPRGRELAETIDAALAR